jgi:alpha,alpha-trehalose-phosphate synthase [UDP-forming]
MNGQAGIRNKHDRLVVVSNRLPFAFERDESGRWIGREGAGGLISALLPVLSDRGGVWIGWPGTAETGRDLEEAVAQAGREAGYALRAVVLEAEEVNNFYHGFSNEVIWPLFHDLQSLCCFDPVYWRTYQQVNRKFAAAVLDSCGTEDFIWVHDYHLMNVALEAKAKGCGARIGFFLHIPFPSPDIYLKLPWRLPLLQALLEYDLIGLQTPRDRRNFVQCLRLLIGDVEVHGKGNVISVTHQAHTTRVGSFPISIDYAAFLHQAEAPGVAARAAEFHRLLPNRKLILGVDRLDYTKGIPQRLQSFRNALDRYPQLRERISLIQVVVPSRVDIPEYYDLKVQIEQLVGEINGSFMRPGGWVPVWYVYSSLTRNDLLAYYRAADIALITPLKDGMNLVAKEYCACSEENCVLILSEFAGAAQQLQRGALLVNPYDIEGVADAIYRAYVMSEEERRGRMRSMRRAVREYDIFWWLDAFLQAAIGRDLSAFPWPENYTHEMVVPNVPL